jgi:LmbE family N-acetylglucosaminyl deacetylase
VPPNTFDQLPTDRTPLETPTRVLTVGAHPDDAEFGCGATLARWAAEGAEVVLCIVTDGSKGSWDASEDADSLIERRRAEQRAAAEVLGVRRIEYLDHVDGEVVASPQLSREVAHQIRLHRPTVVLGHDPWQRYQLHPDHRASGWALVDGVVAAREPRADTGDGLPAHRPDSLMLWSADEPDHAEPVTAEWFDRKVEALLCHSSQTHTTMGDADRGEDERASFVGRLREWHAQAGARLGAAPSETFKRLTP